MDFYSGWQKTFKFTNDIEIIGFSRGSFKSGLMINPFKIFLDAGVCSQYEPNLILISHGHTDHINELYSILIGNTRKFKVPIVSTPTLQKFISNYINASISLNRSKFDKYDKWEPVTIMPNIKKRFNIQGKNIEISCYQMDHSVESIGFGISEIRQKLKEEYINKSHYELNEIKKIYNITDEKEFPLFLFCGDTSHTILNSLPFNFYPIIIIEATFLHDNHIPESREKKHIHISDLIPYFEKYNTNTFLLIHFSSRYTIDEIKTIQKIYEEKYINVKFFI